MRARDILPGCFIVTLALLAAACTDEQKEKAGQTTTTAASATQQKVEDMTKDAKQELKREWKDLDVHVTTGTGGSTADAGATVKPKK